MLFLFTLTAVWHTPQFSRPFGRFSQWMQFISVLSLFSVMPLPNFALQFHPNEWFFSDLMILKSKYCSTSLAQKFWSIFDWQCRLWPTDAHVCLLQHRRLLLVRLWSNANSTFSRDKMPFPIPLPSNRIGWYHHRRSANNWLAFTCWTECPQTAPRFFLTRWRRSPSFHSDHFGRAVLCTHLLVRPVRPSSYHRLHQHTLSYQCALKKYCLKYWQFKF